jgi:hypothetical protein
MKRVILSSDVRSQLADLTTPLELCDESGGVLGYFLTCESYNDLLVSFARAVVSDEEVERRMREPGGCSLQDLWQRLGSA